MGLRTVFIAAALGCGLFCGPGLSSARAQHVVTDVEAGKLTLDALTATPRPIYRQILAVRRLRHGSEVSRPMHVSQVAYRRRIGRRFHR